MSDGNQPSMRELDFIARVNETTISLGPSITIINTYLAQSQATSMLLINSTLHQYQQAASNLAITAENTSKIFERRRIKSSKKKNTDLLNKINDIIQDLSALESRLANDEKNFFSQIS